jgi:hypothetical protein
MTDQHPITPPPELVAQWASESFVTQHLCTQIARWGAEVELEACCELLKADGYKGKAIDLRAARRPQPPTLKEQALDELTSAERLYPADWSTIRRALNKLPDN